MHRYHCFRRGFFSAIHVAALPPRQWTPGSVRGKASARLPRRVLFRPQSLPDPPLFSGIVYGANPCFAQFQNVLRQKAAEKKGSDQCVGAIEAGKVCPLGN